MQKKLPVVDYQDCQNRRDADDLQFPMMGSKEV